MGIAGVVIFSAAVGGLVRRHTRGTKVRTRRRKSRSGPSWLVTVYNNTGATPVKNKRLSGAVAELIGRGTGHAVRKAKEKAGRLADSAGDWWDARQEDRIKGSWITRLPKTSPDSDASSTDDGDAKKRADVASRFAGAWKKVRPDATTTSTTDTTEASTSGSRENTSMTETTIFGSNDTDSTDQPSNPLENVPGHWAPLISAINNFHPTDEAELMAFFKKEAAGIRAYAAAMNAKKGNLIETEGLDPVALTGMSDFAEAASDASSTMRRSADRFITHYEQVLTAVANGVRLPFRGRFLTGGSL